MVYILLCFGVVNNGFGLALLFFSSLYPHQFYICTVYCFTVQLETTWHQPALSSVNKTSHTIRWLKMMEEKEEKENCHVLTTALLTRGPWEKGANTGMMLGSQLMTAYNSD